MDQSFAFTRIFLWRHPEVAGAADGRFYGHTDVPLSQRGKSQMQLMVGRMSSEKLSGLYCSDLQRSCLVAEAMGRSLNPRRRAKSLAELRELNLGVWEGLSFRDISKRYPQELAARYADLPSFRIQGGESLEDLAQRVLPVFQELVAEHRGGQVCVVAHGGVNRVILAKLLGAPLDRVFRLEQEYACLNVIDVYEDGTPVIKRLNEPAPRSQED